MKFLKALKKMFTQNIPIKLLAIFLAVLITVFVNAAI